MVQKKQCTGLFLCCVNMTGSDNRHFKKRKLDFDEKEDNDLGANSPAREAKKCIDLFAEVLHARG